MSLARLLLLPAALLAAAAPAGAATNGSYKGKTDQNRAVTFAIKKNKVLEFQAGMFLHCNTMGNNRFQTDAIANLPAIRIKGSKFDYKDEDVEIHGTIKGKKVTGTASLSRADSGFYDGMLRFGVCAAWDRKFTAKKQ